MRDRAFEREPLGKDVLKFLRYMEIARDSSPRTIADYESVLARFATDFAHLDISAFEGAAGAELVLDFIHEHFSHLSPATRRKAVAILASFFKWAALFDRIEKNPADRIDRPKRRPTLRRAHPPQRIREIVEAQRGLGDRVPILLMARLGLRKNELRLLQWRDIDLHVGALLVHAKGGDDHELPIGDPEIIRQIAQLSLERDPEPTHHVLYPTRIGNLPHQLGLVRHYPQNPMQPSTMHRWWVRCLTTAGVEHFPMHELRHTAGNEFRRATGDLELTRAFMRHASVSTTSEYYMHVDREEIVKGMAQAARRSRR
jgi:integrase